MERVDIQEAYVWQERIEEFKKSGFSQRKWVSVKSDDTLQRIVSSKTRISNPCGPKIARSDDTLRHVVSSKNRNMCPDSLKTPKTDDTLRRIVSSKTRILRPNSLKLQNLMIPRDEDMLCS